MKPRWQLLTPDPHIVQTLSQTLPCSPLTATLLVNRGLTTPEAADTFLNASLQHLRSPFSLKDMDVAVPRIHSAIVRQEKILIFGDYDVDGITAAALLHGFLKHCGANVTCYIPHRVTEGYGLKVQHIDAFAANGDCDLIITVDCGSSSHTAVEAARGHQMDVIITDHHHLADDLPPALAVINPKRADCTAGLQHLAGVGVAFYLLIALRSWLREAGFWKTVREPNLKHCCDLVALGTVADMVPLCEENRIFSRTGLNVMQQQQRAGIWALLEDCGLLRQPAEAGDISFRLAPRLNAAGRLKHAHTALKLLMQQDPEASRTLARDLSQLNKQRQAEEQLILDDILETLRGHPEYLATRSLVLFDSQWHQGILGIVAARLMQRYYRPVILLSLVNGRAKGSARSIPGFDLYQGLSACTEWLSAFGGHAMAAGLEIDPDNIDRFRRHFNQVVTATTTPDDFVPLLTIDSRLPLNQVHAGLFQELDTLKPFGSGNPEPVFVAEKVRVLTSTIVGQNHRRMMLQDESATSPPIEAIQFNAPVHQKPPAMLARLVFRLHRNHWQGRVKNQLLVVDYENFPC